MRFSEPIDLHLHSDHSDGTESPGEVMRQAYAYGVRTAALTDHDRVSGWGEAAEVAKTLGMTFVPGMEMSTRIGRRSVHMLAYLFDPTNGPLLAESERVRGDRIGRAERIVARISADYSLTWQDVLEQTAGDATIGRPHIADALIARGIVIDRAEAFERILHPGGGYYEPYYSPDPFRAIELILAAGGVPVIAHAMTVSRSELMSIDVVEQLVDAGLAGLEIDHRENDEAGKEMLRELASRRDLIVTGSSDYHGDGKPNRPGENTTHPEMLARIIAAGTGISPVYP
jgi:predicted metal-dependent phosphoesterase TrpH